MDRETQLQVLAEQLEAAKQVAAEDQSAGFEASMLQQNLQTQISGANALMARLTEERRNSFNALTNSGALEMSSRHHRNSFART